MEKIISDLPREITKNKVNEFLEKFKYWSMFARVDQDWLTEYSVCIKFSLKNKIESIVTISINEDSSIDIESNKVLTENFFLLDIGKLFKKDSC